MNDELKNSIKTLTRAYYDYQTERIRLTGMLGMKGVVIKKSDEMEDEGYKLEYEIKKGVPEKDMGLLLVLTKRLKEVLLTEKGTKKILCEEVHKHKLWECFLKDVKGCGEGIAAVIISEIDIVKAAMVSQIVSFAGMAPGKDKKVKGQKCTFNQFLKKILLGVLGSSFLKSNSPYREYYDNMRNRLEQKNWGMDAKNPSDKNKPKAFHQHRAANRFMIKMFIKDLYVAWRTLENLPVRKPYEEEYLGKVHHEAM